MATPIRLLYVDDEVDNLSVFKSAFKKDFAITLHESPAEALQEFSTNSFEIVIADQRMPEMTGVEFLEKVHEINPDAVRILLTEYSQLDAIVNAINRGRIFYYCTKPWKKDELQIVLVKAIEHYNLIKRNHDLIQRLSSSVKELEVFLYRASHDLRAPITTQLGLLNLLKEEVTGSASIYVEKIEEMIHKLENTLEKMSQLSNSGYEYIQQNFSSDISEIVQTILRKFNGTIQDRNISIRESIQPAEGFLFERNYLMILLNNILENAIQYTREGSGNEIKITSEYNATTDQLVITVQDQGIGISAMELNRVFEPFFRGTTSSKGNGLGLYIVKKVCELIRATIDLSSTPNEGTLVKLTLTNLNKQTKR